MLRRTTTSDPAFRSLVALLDADLRARYGDVQQQYDAFNGLAGDEPAVVAYAGDEPVGCGCFRRREARVELKRMFVAPAHRRQGFAAALLHELERWARELGHASAVLETGTLQQEAIALYEREGYRRIAPFPPYDRLPYSVCMEKQLAG